MGIWRYLCTKSCFYWQKMIILNKSFRQVKEAHVIYGWEFDSVAVPMDSKFSHDKNGDLVVNELCNMSDRVQMLYEMVTRARNELNIVVINNFPLFEKLE